MLQARNDAGSRTPLPALVVDRPRAHHHSRACPRRLEAQMGPCPGPSLHAARRRRADRPAPPASGPRTAPRPGPATRLGPGAADPTRGRRQLDRTQRRCLDRAHHAPPDQSQRGWDYLRRLGYIRQCPRPRHAEAASAAAHAAWQTTSSSASPPERPSPQPRSNCGGTMKRALGSRRSSARSGRHAASGRARRARCGTSGCRCTASSVPPRARPTG